MMKRKRYGRTSLQVSELCLGTGRIGLLGDRASAMSLLDAYVECGGNFIQVSPMSQLTGLQCSAAEAESLVGEWLGSRPRLRESIILSARIRCPAGAKGLDLERALRGQVEDVLRRTGAGHLDIALLDWTFGPFHNVETMQALERLADRGLLRYAGATGFPCWKIAEWLGQATPSRMRLESVHLDGPFTQCCLEEMSEEHRVSLVARWPYPAGYEPLFRTAKEMFGNTSFQVGMSWLFSRPSICSVQFAPKLVPELLAAVAAARFRLSPEELERVEVAYLECALPSNCPNRQDSECGGARLLPVSDFRSG